MSQRPLIGLTAANTPVPDWGQGRFLLDRDGQNRLYAEAVALAGGLPVILPLVRSPMDEIEDDFSACGPGNLHDNARVFVERLDGLLLTGGGDLAPPTGATDASLYRQVDRTRDVWELALLASALELGKPVLGLCRGVQVMNVALGGNLWADLPTERPGAVEHAQSLPRARATHEVEIEAGSRLADILTFSRIMVNSGHHQGLKDLAPSLAPAARAADGLVEAVEHRNARFAVGVQWHPEGQPAEAHSRALFAAFVQAAQA